MKHRSMSLNAILGIVKTLTNLAFPLLTYPYITRVLSVSNLGKVNFSQTLVSYFAILAQFGILQFAVRTGAPLRDQPTSLRTFARQIFSINVITTSIALILLGLVMILPTPLMVYRPYVIILSLTVLSVPLAVDWLCFIFEDFLYLTLRTILINVVSILLMFRWVKDDSDVLLYVFLLALVASVGNLSNFLYTRKYVKLSLIRQTNWSQYRGSLWLFFITSLTTMVYLNADITLLGLLASNQAVGLYAVATKVYAVTKQLINSAITTTLARLAYVQRQDEQAFRTLLRQIIAVTSFFAYPLMMGIILLRREALLILATPAYLVAAPTLALLALALIFGVFANVLGQGLLVVLQREKYVVWASIASATVNVLLNFWLIPLAGIAGAALTTIIAEIVLLAVTAYGAREYLPIIFTLSDQFKALGGSLVMLVSGLFWQEWLHSHLVLRVVETVAVAGVIYLATMWLFRSQTLKIMVAYLRKGQSNVK
ncbi:polysaccharide biosynthesis C-terminal domain-containing protein [Ligilactobacillus equi]|uniref:oligosaccharide flippase family protein n=1 Tax=Ligilactobacillus equi TaxID=137357 RepID=UPI002ED58BE6